MRREMPRVAGLASMRVHSWIRVSEWSDNNKEDSDTAVWADWLLPWPGRKRRTDV